ncbi:MAG: phosphoribosylglycinamide formyltransferase [Prochloron sp. SP5CPC1]|nr:phosphoribosylglycinamide formyltransferase [Candidatus Paraprochloron terpiosi SP5CPC1]
MVIDAIISPTLHQTLGQMVKLGIMASGSGTNFEAVAGAIDSGRLNATIPVLIYNNPEAKVKSRADSWGVPAVLVEHGNYQHREDFDDAIVKVLQSYGVQWVVMAGWMRVVTQVLLDAYPSRVINIHPSLLPSFRGMRAVERALKAGVKITGCTAHLVSLEVDSGPILIQAAVPVLPEDTPESLHGRIQVQEHLILPEAIAMVSRRGAESQRGEGE